MTIPLLAVDQGLSPHFARATNTLIGLSPNTSEIVHFSAWGRSRASAYAPILISSAQIISASALVFKKIDDGGLPALNQA